MLTLQNCTVTFGLEFWEADWALNFFCDSGCPDSRRIFCLNFFYPHSSPNYTNMFLHRKQQLIISIFIIFRCLKLRHSLPVSESMEVDLSIICLILRTVFTVFGPFPGLKIKFITTATTLKSKFVSASNSSCHGSTKDITISNELNQRITGRALDHVRW